MTFPELPPQSSSAQSNEEAATKWLPHILTFARRVMTLRTPNQVMRQWATFLPHTFDAVQAALVFEYEDEGGPHVIAQSGRVRHLIREIERHSPVENGYVLTNDGILWWTLFDKEEPPLWGAVLVSTKQWSFLFGSMLEIIATLATMAYRNTLHIETTNRYQALMKALHATTLMVVSKHNLDSVFAQVLSGLALLVPYDSAAVMLLDEDGTTFRIVAAVGFESEEVTQVRIDARDDALFQEIVCRKAPLVLPDAQRDPRFQAYGKTTYVRSWIGVPIRVGERIVGMLTIDNTRPNIYTEEHAHIALMLADQAGIAITNVRLLERLQKMIHASQNAARRWRLLNTLGQRLAHLTNDVHPLMEEVAHATAQLIEADRVLVYWLDIEERRVLGFASGGPSHHLAPQVPFEELEAGLTGWAIRHRKTAVSPKGKRDPRESDTVAQHRLQTKSGSTLVAPMIFEGRIVGTMTAIRDWHQPDFDESDREVLETIATQMAVALQNHELYVALQRQAKTDPLTGIYNRRYLFEVGEREVIRSHRLHLPLSVILFDLDHFKRINDTYGHLVGDRVLVHVAHGVQQLLRSSDILARYGGEEFAILLPGLPLDRAVMVANRIHQWMHTTPCQTDKEAVPISGSFGVVTLLPHMQTFSALLEVADDLLYRAKELGRNRVEIMPMEDESYAANE
nr:sensor domain-containing diguanylate cyclase [Ardenticatena sp.]